MPKPTVTHATFTIERNYPAPLDRLFRAFTDPAQKRDWFAGGKSSTLEEFTMDFRPSGHDYPRTRFPPGSPFPGAALENHTVYQDIVDNQRIVLAYTMSVAGRRISASLATFEFFAAATGSTLLFTEQAAFFEHAAGAAMREERWIVPRDTLAAHLAACSPTHPPRPARNPPPPASSPPPPPTLAAPSSNASRAAPRRPRKSPPRSPSPSPPSCSISTCLRNADSSAARNPAARAPAACTRLDSTPPDIGSPPAARHGKTALIVWANCSPALKTPTAPPLAPTPRSLPPRPLAFAAPPRCRPPTSKTLQ